MKRTSTKPWLPTAMQSRWRNKDRFGIRRGSSCRGVPYDLGRRTDSWPRSAVVSIAPSFLIWRSMAAHRLQSKHRGLCGSEFLLGDLAQRD
eukprot:6936907-Pyramimonas_sp.AAC.1